MCIIKCKIYLENIRNKLNFHSKTLSVKKPDTWYKKLLLLLFPRNILPINFKQL